MMKFNLTKQCFLSGILTIPLAINAFAQDSKELGSIPNEIAEWELVWSDEFEGNTLDSSIWNVETGWYKNPNTKSIYSPENVKVSDGFLKLTASGEEGLFNDKPHAHTLGRVTTETKFAFTYGRVEISARVPVSPAIKSALWMLGASKPDVGWPACGEIDILEYWGPGGGKEISSAFPDLLKRQFSSNLHWGPSFREHSYMPGKYTFPSSSEIEASNPYKIVLVWDEEFISVFVNNEQVGPPKPISDADKAAFHNPFYFVFQINTGGPREGKPPERIEKAHTLAIDYVRVYQKK